MRTEDFIFSSGYFRSGVLRATRCYCFDSSSSSTTASQPAQNITGAGSPATQGASSPVVTGQAVGGVSGSKVNTGSQVDASTAKNTATANGGQVNTGSIVKATVGNNNTISMDGGAIQAALDALTHALGTSQTSIAQMSGQVAPPATILTIPTAAAPAAATVVSVSLQNVLLLIAAALGLLLFFKKKSA